MPRIAAALAVFLTVVTCIGFNTARYPVVWEMVAARDGLPQSREPDEPAASAQATVLAQSARFTETRPEADSTAFWESGAESAETTAWESATVEPISAHPSDTAERSSPRPIEGGPIVVEDYAPIHKVAKREPPARDGGAFDPVAPGDSASRPVVQEKQNTSNDEPNSETALVPVKPSNAGQGFSPALDAESSSASSAVAGAGDRKGTSNTKRLPPVDVVSIAPGADRRPPRQGDSIPIYPTTGVR